MNLAELIKKHKFDEVNKDILRGTVDFPVQEIRATVPEAFRLFEISAPQTSFKEVQDFLENNSSAPANIYELLTWEGWDGQSTIAALGSIVELDGEKYVPCISLDHFRDPDRYYSMRRLSLLNIARDWRGAMLFLGVKK